MPGTRGLHKLVIPSGGGPLLAAAVARRFFANHWEIIADYAADRGVISLKGARAAL